MLHKNTLGQLQLKKSGIEAGFAEDREHALQKVLVPKLRRGDVYRHRRYRAPSIRKGSSLPARFTKDPCADRQNEAAVFRDGDKF